MISRRNFIEATAVSLTAACARSSALGEARSAPAPSRPGTRLPLGFSTLGCPRWEWAQVLDFAAAHGYAAVELRGLLMEMDLTKRLEFAPTRLDETRRQLANH